MDNNLFYLILIFICFLINVSNMIRLIHVFQLHNYNIDQQIIWYKKNYKLYIVNFLLAAVFIVYNINNNNFFLFVLALLFLIMFILSLPKKQKKPLVYTNRVKRQIGFNIIIFLMSFVLFFCFDRRTSLIISIVITILSPFIVFISFLILKPIEDNIKNKFINIAKNKIKSMNNINVIGITGSFGKTSVKNYLYDMLVTKYNTCVTPESYNTTMGNTITINNTLKTYDEFYISEMGARRVNDIKEICDVVSPNSCILTEVDKQHLDTFKNIENILKTKFELVDAVSDKINTNEKENKKSFILINGDNKLIKNNIKKYDENVKKHIYTYGLNDDNNFYAGKIKITSNGTSFDFIMNVNGKTEKFEFNTKLIGAHNIMNLVSCIAMAYLYGVGFDNLKLVVKNIKQVSHRLELIKYSDKQIILDDAYNSNIKGFKSAIDTLSNFDDTYTKILITPGMVELSDEQYNLNFEAAKYAAKVCDYAFVVNKVNKQALLDGLNSVTSINKNNIKYFDTFNDAMEEARKIVSDKKVILIENDLTDNY